MFQSYVFFSNNLHNSILRKGDLQKALINLIYRESPEEEEAAATSLGAFPRQVYGIFMIIHRVPSIEEAAATSLGNFNLIIIYLKINRKNAPYDLFLVFTTKKGE